MVEAINTNSDKKVDSFVPSPEEKEMITKLLGEKAVVDGGYKTNIALKKADSETRAKFVEHIEYDFSLALDKGDYFIGNAVVNFYLKELPGDDLVFLNFNGMAVSDLMINMQDATNSEVFQNQRITFKQTQLVKGWNTVELKYFTAYNKSQVGLHTFTDQSDKEQYLYTQFETTHCLKVFPCFDQPNLKAKMTLVITCPQEWKAISNSIEKRFDYFDGEQGKHVLERNRIDWFLGLYKEGTQIVVNEYEQTPKISTYLYAVCAGPYEMWEDNDPQYVPQRVFVRQSLIENMQYELVFGVTKTTMDFYQPTYGQRYPFSKVDHVFCPDYKYGAMENVGCITYGDGLFCIKKEMNTVEMTFFVVVIQHELCHMWFGNLVTMQWWNDLWLNEAFATSLSYKACSEGGKCVDSYKHEAYIHMSGYKRWGLGDDLASTNHCIQADVPTTDAAESLIDGITYGKGTSMITQLMYLMSWPVFTLGLKIYFKKHAWGNTVLEDFIGAMQQAYNEEKPDGDLDLTAWANQWLKTKGSNRIEADIESADGKYTKFNIKQTFHKHSTEIYRQQRFNISFYGDEGNLIHKEENVLVKASEITEIKALVGKDVVPAILLNSEDWGWGHFILDESTIKVFEQKLARIDTPINKAVIMGQVIGMMKQVEYPATRLPTIMNQFMDETNQNLLKAMSQALTSAKATFLPVETVPKFNLETATFFLKKAKKEAPANMGLVAFCIDTALGFTTSTEHLTLTADWILTDKIMIENEEIAYTLNKQQKYAICQHYWASPAFTLEQKTELRDKALEGDNSDQAQDARKLMSHSLPETDLKEKLWTEFMDPQSKESLLEIKLKMRGFWQRGAQLDLITPYFEKYYSAIQRVVDSRDRQFGEAFLYGLSPAFMAREQDEKAFTELLSKTTDETHFFTLFLKKQIETIELIKKSRDLCENYRVE